MGERDEGVLVLPGLDPVELAVLEQEVDVPVTSSSSWWATWLEHEEGVAFPVTVRRDGRLVAFLPLVVHDGPVREVVVLGHEVGDRCVPWALDHAAERALAAAVAARVQSLPGRWRLTLDQLDVRSARFAVHVAHALRGVVEPGDGCPVVPLTGLDIDDIGSRNWRKQVRQAGRRIDRDGHDHRVEVTDDADAIVALLPVISELHRARDHDLDRVSDLDDDARRRFWRRMVTSLARHGRLTCLTLVVGDEVVAYELVIHDGGVLRNWDGRFRPGSEDWWPGTIMLHAVLELGFARSADTVDLMRGETFAKLRVARDVDDHLRVRAWSHPGVRLLDRTRSGARDRVRRLRDEHPPLDRAYRALKQRLVLP